ncbi:MAG: putative LPS assembly protein LptD [Ferruginibacter sp.]
MNHLYKGKAKLILARLCLPLLSILITLQLQAFDLNDHSFHISLTQDSGLFKIKQQQTDSAAIKNQFPPALTETPKEIRKNTSDTTIKKINDTVTYKISKDTLNAPVTYHADDSMVFDVPGKKLILYGKTSKVNYEDNELTSPLIEYNQSTNLVTAYLLKDSTGAVIAFPEYSQADFKSKSDTIQFNMKSQKGITKGTYTQQGEMYVYGKTIKKVNRDVFFAERGRFTTCNLDTPHFAFVSNKIKFVNKKMAYSGPVHPEFEGVPIPVYLPFGIFPMSKGRHSGLIAPSFTANDQMGIALEGLGYYKILSQTWDVIARGTIYSYGGWTASVNPRYFKKYRYNGNVSIDVQHFKTNFKGDPDYSSTNSYNIRWTHSADTRARPGVNFSANVNAGSSKFNSQVPNSPTRNFTNQLNSSITYSKVWKNKPFNVSVSANHNQNTIQKQININLPDVAFNVNTQYPFRRKEVTGDLKWYENIGIALNTNARSLTSFYDTAANIGKQMVNNLQWGASHNVPLTVSLPQLGPLTLAPSITYQEKWYQQKTVKSWNSAQKKIDTSITKGFYTARDMNFGLSITTRIFGMFTFRKSSRVQAIRHEIRPTISVNYKPDFARNAYYSTQVDTFGRVERYSVYERSVFGAFSEGKFGGINFGIDNNLQMKVRSKKDTGEAAIKKVTLLDGFSITGSYNLIAKSFKLSPFSLSARSNLFDKVSITASAILDPYKTDTLGQRIDKYVWSNKFAIGNLTSGSVSLQSSFRGGDKKSKVTADPNTLNNTTQQLVDASGYPLDEYQQEAAYIRNNPGEFADFSIPWDVSLSYSLRFNRVRNSSNTGFRTDLSQDVNWNASVNLTPRWKLGVNGFYNITLHELGTISMYLSREMHCWQMSINISPVGKYRFFTINISPKSGILRDLKVNRTRYFYEL